MIQWRDVFQRMSKLSFNEQRISLGRFFERAKELL
ncbi:unnamed protein product [Paramecium sonneborni]|uniref:Uncharacterized protein n=1 Tax=Paramecium sonneborni TaxID=65129 RepID=A0A8S1RV64_9CILI|nr:unnamed protein product [Paramecium sonneborni]